MKSENQDCMIIRGSVGGKTFRPSSGVRGMHWAAMLVDQYSDYADVSVKWIDGEAMVTITPTLKVSDEVAFEHINDFARLHDLEITACRSACEKCGGHHSCQSPFS